MPTYQFAGYRLDTSRLALRRAGRSIALRPKTASVLALLIENRERVVTKREMAEQVWPSVHVTDQSLFQAVSELRRALAPLDPIATHPNLGYQWAVPVRDSAQTRRWATAAALLALLASTLFAALPGGGEPARANAAWSAGLPPAMQALATGLQHLEAGEPARAQAYFELAIRENPSFAEARLLLSEALLAQDKLVDARHNIRWLIESAGVASDPYVSVAAMDLMSRTDLREGHAGAALGWARQAAGHARDRGFVCAAADLDGRIEAMMSPLPDIAPADAGAPIVVAGLADADAVPDYCRQIRPLRPDPDARHRDEGDSIEHLSAACGARRQAYISNA